MIDPSSFSNALMTGFPPLPADGFHETMLAVWSIQVPCPMGAPSFKGLLVIFPALPMSKRSRPGRQRPHPSPGLQRRDAEGQEGRRRILRGPVHLFYETGFLVDGKPDAARAALRSASPPSGANRSKTQR
jgi:hypothetical protein